MSLTVEVQRVLSQLLRLQVLCPPFVQGGILQTLDERLQAVNHVELGEHSGHFSLVRATLDVVLNGTVDFMNCLEVLGHLEMRVFQVDPVVLLGNLDGFVPLAAGHVQLYEQIVSAAFFI